MARQIFVHPDVLSAMQQRAWQLDLDLSAYVVGLWHAELAGKRPITALAPLPLAYRYTRARVSISVRAKFWAKVKKRAKQLGKRGSAGIYAETLAITEIESPDPGFTIWPEPGTPKPTIRRQA